MTGQTILPRGIRNNNPLNIRLSPDNRWQGRLSPRLNSDGAFEQFQDPIMGLRAAAVLLVAHYDRYAEIAIPAESFARAVVFAMSRPEDVDVNENLFRPTRQEL